MNDCSQDASSSSHTPTPKPTPHTSDICDKYGCKYRMRSDYNIPDNKYQKKDAMLSLSFTIFLSFSSCGGFARFLAVMGA